MEKTETVSVTVTVKVAKKFYEFLEGFGKLNDMKPEDFIEANAYANLRDFFSGGSAELWFGQILKNGRELEQLAKKVENEVYAATS